MYEGIKILNGTNDIDLSKLEKMDDGSYVLNGINTLKIYLSEESTISPKVDILENNSDVKVSLTDGTGNEIPLVLKGLGDILLTNNEDIPAFEVFEDDQNVISMTTIDDLEAAAAGGTTQSNTQTENGGIGDALDGTESDAFAQRVDGLDLGDLEDPEDPLDGNTAPVISDLLLSDVYEVLGEESAGDKNIITGQLTVTSDDIEDEGTHTFSYVAGTLTITNESGVITELEDEVEITINLDGSFSIIGDFNDLAVGENATITFDYVATDGRGATSDPATVTLTVLGTNDIPVIENVSLNGNEVLLDPSDIEEEIQNDGTLYETNDLDYGEDGDTIDDGNNIYTGQLSVADDDDTDTHTFYLAEDGVVVTNTPVDEENNPIITVDDLDITIDEDGTYNISGDFSALAAGENATVSVEYYALDDSGVSTDGDQLNESSESEHKYITFTITGTNDQPIVEDVIESIDETYDETDEIGEDDTKDDELTTFESELPEVEDDDVNDTHTYKLVEGTIQLDGEDTEAVTVNVNEDGSYSVEGDFNYLGADESAIVTFEYTATDNSSGDEENNVSESKTVTLTVNGTNDQPIVEDITTVVSEESLDGAVGTLMEDSKYVGSVSEAVTDDDENDTHTFSIDEGSLSISITTTNQAFLALFSLDDLAVAEDLIENISNNNLDFSILNTDSNNIADSVTIGTAQTVTLSQDFIDLLEEYGLLTIQMDSQTGEYSVESPIFNLLGAGDSLNIEFDYRATDDAGVETYDGTNELSESEAGTISLTIEGTNDQPVAYPAKYITIESNLDDTIQGDENSIFTGLLPGANSGSLLGDIFTRLQVNDTKMGMDEDLLDTTTIKFYLDDTADINTTVIERGFFNNIDNVDVVDISQTVVLVNEDGSFSVINPTFDNLSSGEIATVSFKYYVDDGSSSLSSSDNNHESTQSDSQLVTVTIVGTNDQPEVMDISLDAIESRDGHGSDMYSYINGVLVATDDDVNNTHKFNIVDYNQTENHHGHHDRLNQNSQTDNERIDSVEVYENGIFSRPDIVEVLINSEDVNVNNLDVTRLVLSSNNGNDSEARFTLEGDFNALASGETATVTFKYYANDQEGYGLNGTLINEASKSEIKTVTITITGTNDQPVVKDILINDFLESTDSNLTNLSGVLTAFDEDISNTHVFKITDYTASDYYGHNQGGPGANGDQGDVRFDTVDVYQKGSSSTPTEVKMLISSEDVDVSKLDITQLTLYNNNGEDSSVNFDLSGNFEALAVGETATVKFEYFANDRQGFGNNGDIENEASKSETKIVTLTITGTNDAPIISVENTTNISFVSEDADFNNILIAYTLDENGNPINPIVVVSNSNADYSNGDFLGALNLSIDDIHFALIADSASTYPNIINSQLSFDLTGDYPTLKIDGENSTNPVYFDINSFNSDGKDHFDVVDNGDGTLTINMEDQNLGDNDRTDLVIKLSGNSVEGTISELVEDDEFEGAEHNISGTISFDDVDINDTHTIQTIENGDNYLGTFTPTITTSATGNNQGVITWNYNVDDSTLDYLAEGETITQVYTIEIDDGNGGTDTQDVTITITGTNDAPILTYDGQVDNINETLNGVVLGILSVEDIDGDITLDNFNLSGEDSDLVEVIQNDGTFELRLKDGVILDYETNPNLDVTVTYNDGYDSSSQNISVAVNNITGIVSTTTSTIPLIGDNFNGGGHHCVQDGWILGWGTHEVGPNQNNQLGWFSNDRDYVYKTFDLDGHSGETVNVSFDLNISGESEGHYHHYHHSGSYGEGWEGNDTLNVCIVDNHNNIITNYSQSPNGEGSVDVSFDLTVPEDGNFTIYLSSDNTDDWGKGLESWAIDDFKITGSVDGDQILSFDNSSSGEIDMGTLLSQSYNTQTNDFEDTNGDSVDAPDSLDKIDLTSGDHILSNISISDVLSMTDNDNTLEIKGEEGDTIKLDLAEPINNLSSLGEDNQWHQLDGQDDTYVGKIGDDVVQLIIDGIDVEDTSI